MDGTQKFRASRYGLLCSLVLWASSSWAQQMGEAVGVEGTVEFLRAPATTWAALARRGDIVRLDQLRTQSSSKLDVLLQTGHKFVLGENVEISVAEQPTPPSGSRIALLLARGSVRVVTSGRPGTSIVTRTPTGQAVARSTGFIVSCGPPETASLDVCLFVGLYGQIEVESLTSPGSPVVLDPQFFTLVARNQLPTPPQRASDAQFQDQIDATTLVGASAQLDRLAVADSLEFLLGGPQRPLQGPFDPSGPIPDVHPPLYAPLPLPPPPPPTL
jgi:hypothetical protein